MTTEFLLQWVGAEQLPMSIANQFAVQLGLPAKPHGPDGVVLLVGEAAPPVLISPADEVIRRQTHGNALPVRPHGRFYLSRARLGELRDLLSHVIEQYDEIHAQPGDQGDDDADRG